MIKQLTALTLAGAMASIAGCAVDTGPSDVRTTKAFSTSTSCNENSGINPMKAALAVAMSREIGRIDPLTDLTISDKTIVLTSAGKNQCQARGEGNCPNVQAILDMQKDEVNKYVDQNIFNATTFRSDLRASFDRQQNHEHNLKMNAPDRLPQPHSLKHAGISDLGACGVHYDFDADGHKVENLKERMPFFGGTENPFIDFRSSDGRISIDPTGTMNGDTTTTSGACSVGCYSYDTSLKYSCCACNGKQGKWYPATWSSSMVYCSY